MKQQYFKSGNNQKGIYIPTVAAIFVTLLTILGFAIDTTNIYRAKIRMQRAVDAGVIAAIHFLAEMDMEDETYSDEQRNKARQLAESIVNFNLARANMSLSNNVTINVSPVGKVMVDGNANVPLLFLRMIPGFSSNIVNAMAEGVVKEESTNDNLYYIVSIVLDRTGSMNCPAEGPCCMGTNNCCHNAYGPNGLEDPLPSFCKNGSQPKPTKLNKLKEAVKNFINNSLKNSDQVSLVSFSSDVIVMQNMTYASDNVKTYLKSGVDGIRGFSGTNIYQGVEAGSAQFALAERLPERNYKEILLLVTDGAPTFDKKTVQVCNNQGQCHQEEKDYNCQVNKLTGSNNTSQADPVYLENGGTCNAGGGPITDGRVCYIRALQAADRMRSQLANKSIYAVGFGQMAGLSGDPYQDYHDGNPLKPYFMKRLANTDTTEVMQNGELVKTPSAPGGDPAFNCIDSFQNYNDPNRYSTANPAPQKGRYLQATTGNEVVDLFEEIFTNLGPRLTQ